MRITSRAFHLPLPVCTLSPHNIFRSKIDKRRTVSEEEGRRWAAGHGFVYFETSASSGASVGAAFMKLFEMALARMKET